MKNNYSKEDRAAGLQSGIIIILNVFILTFFNFSYAYTVDFKGICSSIVSALIPIIINVYKHDDESRIVKHNFKILKSRICFSFCGVIGILMTALFEWIMLRIGSGMVIIEYFYHLITLFVGYAGFITMGSFVVLPWIYGLLFYLEKKIYDE